MNGITRIQGVRKGRPCVEGTGIETAGLRDRFLAGDSMAGLADDYEISMLEVEQAIRFECCKACPCESCNWSRSLTVEKSNPRGTP